MCRMLEVRYTGECTGVAHSKTLYTVLEFYPNFPHFLDTKKKNENNNKDSKQNNRQYNKVSEMHVRTSSKRGSLPNLLNAIHVRSPSKGSRSNLFVRTTSKENLHVRTISRGNLLATSSWCEKGDRAYHEHAEGVSYEDDNTIYGDILRGNAPCIVLDENEDFLAFQDKNPRAPLHGVLITKQYIKSVLDLKKEDLPMLKKMNEMAVNIVKELSSEAYEKGDFKLCFHVPPHCSVDHLALHIIAPLSKTNFFHKHNKNNNHAISIGSLMEHLKAGKTGEKIYHKPSPECEYCYENNHTVFGEILRGEKSAQTLDESETLLAFEDIHPRAPFHALIIPKQHVHNVFALSKEHLPMLHEMKATAHKIVKEFYPAEYQRDDFKLAFHVPPFTAVDHLCLHVLAPASERNIIDRNGIDSVKSGHAITLDLVIGQLEEQGRISPMHQRSRTI